MEGKAKLTGLAMVLTGGRGEASASGTLAGSTPQSTAFAVLSKTSDNQRSVRMGLRSGRVAKVEIDPPIEPKPDRVPVKAADKRGVVDPMSALLMPALDAKSLTDPANCDRTIPVFDGASRLDVVLSYGETKKVEVPGYSGPVLVCNARYVPISGHRSERPATKFMQENRDKSDRNDVWLGADRADGLVPGGGRQEPAASSSALVSMRTQMVGMGVDLANQIRGVLKPFGLIAGKGGGQAFADRVRALVADGPLQMVAEALLTAWQAISHQLAILTRHLIDMARQDQAVKRLMTTPGVGPSWH